MSRVSQFYRSAYFFLKKLKERMLKFVVEPNEKKFIWKNKNSEIKDINYYALNRKYKI